MNPEGTNQTLNELFLRSGGAEIDFRGRRVHLALDVTLRQKRVNGRVRFISARTSPRQGVAVEAKGGELRIAGQASRRMILWYDSAPEQVDFEATYRSAKTPVLRFWNSWRGGDSGDPQQWIDNAGLVYEEVEAGRYVVRCSDGWDEPEFTDLVFEVVIHG